ncbi:MAG TPA: hypothetical protein VM935_00180, partial [Chitinophagaceae bacterium]|nr:hypothetical protein [Chitinophagaceae bacterium]
AIANHVLDKLYAALEPILSVADNGSVITNDHCVGILIKLCALEAYTADAFPLLMEHINRSPVNQLPM